LFLHILRIFLKYPSNIHLSLFDSIKKPPILLIIRLYSKFFSIYIR